MKIHIANFYGTRNKGDELMLRGLIGELRNQEIKKISVSTFYDPEIDKTVVDEVQFVNSLSNVSNNFVGKITLLFSYILIRFKFINVAKKLLISYNTSLTDTFNSIEEADYIITTGGPFFQESTKKKLISYPTLNYITSFIELLYGSSKGIPYSVVGQSFSKIDFKISKNEFNNILEKAEKIAGRESYSVHLFRESMNCPKKIDVIPDLGLSKSLYDIEIEEILRENLICVNVRSMNIEALKYLIGADLSYEELHKKYVDTVASAIRNIISANQDYKILFLCQAINDDVYISKEVIKKANLKENQYEIIDEKIDLQTYIDIIRKCKFAIVTRYHSMIISLITHTPFVALAYSPKITGALNDYGLKRRNLRNKNFSSEEILRQFRKYAVMKEVLFLEKKDVSLKVTLTNYMSNIFS